jgi:hypothetical protein
MRTETILLASAALAIGTLLGRLTVPISPFALAQPTESSIHRAGSTARRIVLEVPDIASIYNTCDAWNNWDNPVILRP